MNVRGWFLGRSPNVRGAIVLAALGGLGIGGCALCAGAFGGSAVLVVLGFALIAPSLAPLTWLMLETRTARAHEPEFPEPARIEAAAADDDDTQPFSRRGPPPPPPSGVGREAMARLTQRAASSPPPPPRTRTPVPLSQRLRRAG